MPVDVSLVPIEHLKHLIVALNNGDASTPEVATMLALAATGGATERGMILGFLEGREPGISERLAGIWRFRGKKAVQLWEVTCLRNKNIADLISALSAFTGTSKGGWHEWTEQHDPKANHIAEVRFSEESKEVFARVTLVKSMSYSFLGNRSTVLQSTDVDIRISFERDYRVAEVYATYEDAREALLMLLERVTGEAVPRRRGVEQQKFVAPLTFSEQQIKELASRIGLKSISIRGKDPKGALGDLQLWGKLVGENFEELDQTVDIVDHQEQAENAERWYNLIYNHPDGFTEITQLEFVFSRIQPRVVFRTKASRLAIDHLVANLCAVLGRG